MIDVHAHLASDAYADIDGVLARARAAGVRKVVMSITDPKEYPSARSIIGRHPEYVFLTVGFDPCCLDKGLFDEFVSLASSAPAVGIGEVGLDHFYIRDDAQMALQEDRFRAAISIAKGRGLPVVVHSRSAGKKALALLQSEGADRVLMHAFDGKAGDALDASKRGYYFSIPTSVVHSEQKKKLVRLLPLESLMLETDSPVLAPVRGETNEPANLIMSADAISAIKRIPVEDVIAATSYNAASLFRI